MKARLLTEAEQNGLISCEQGARISQEAAGIHYYLRRARNDSMKMVLRNSCVECPKQVAGTASPEAEVAAAVWAVENAGRIHDGISAAIAAVVALSGRADIAGMKEMAKLY